MSFDPRRYRVPISVQVGAVAALFIAALVVLWSTGASFLRASERRADARAMLERAGVPAHRGWAQIIAGRRGIPLFRRGAVSRSARPQTVRPGPDGSRATARVSTGAISSRVSRAFWALCWKSDREKRRRTR